MAFAMTVVPPAPPATRSSPRAIALLSRKIVDMFCGAFAE